MCDANSAAAELVFAYLQHLGALNPGPPAAVEVALGCLSDVNAARFELGPSALSASPPAAASVWYQKFTRGPNTAGGR